MAQPRWLRTVKKNAPKSLKDLAVMEVSEPIVMVPVDSAVMVSGVAHQFRDWAARPAVA